MKADSRGHNNSPFRAEGAKFTVVPSECAALVQKGLLEPEVASVVTSLQFEWYRECYMHPSQNIKF